MTNNRIQLLCLFLAWSWLPCEAGTTLGIEIIKIPLSKDNYVAFTKIKPNSARIRILTADTFRSVIEFERCRFNIKNSCSPKITIDRLVQSLFVSDFAAYDNVLAAVSGGYMSSFSPLKALGFVQIAGEQLSRPHNTWLGRAVFCTDGDHFEIGKFEGVRALFPLGDCIQSGPLFLEGSVSRYSNSINIDADEEKLAESVQEQAFACKTKLDELIIGVTGKMTLRDLSEIAAKKLNCNVAIRLTGYTTASLQAGDSQFGNEELPVYSVISVLSRSHEIKTETNTQ